MTWRKNPFTDGMEIEYCMQVNYIGLTLSSVLFKYFILKN